MPLGTRLRSAWLALFASPAYAAVMQPHPPVAEGAWLRPRPTRQSPDCRRGRGHRHASRRPARVRLKAAAFPAQHIRSALSQCVAGEAAHVAPCGPFGRFASLAAALRFAPAHFRLRRIPAGRRVRMRRGLPSPGSEYLPSPDRRHLACLRPRLPPSPPPPRAAAPPARSALPWHGKGSVGNVAKLEMISWEYRFPL